MRALTVHQPWAWAIAHGHKDVENRQWRTEYRGPLLVHAGTKIDHGAQLGVDPPAVFDHGAVVAVVELVDIVDDSTSPWAMTKHWHWRLESVRRLDDPVPARGRLGLWVPDPQLVAAVAAQLASR